MQNARRRKHRVIIEDTDSEDQTMVWEKEDCDRENENEERSNTGKAGAEEISQSGFKSQSGKSKRGRKANASKGAAVCDGNLRRWLFVTLSHTEEKEVELSECCERLGAKFDVSRGIGVREQHNATLGEHYHIAFECSDASRNTAAKIVRSLFPEFEGRGVDLKFHKAFSTMLVYATKEQGALENAYYFGGYSRECAEDDISAKRGKTMSAVYAVRKHMEEGLKAEELVYNDDVASFMLRSASSVMTFARMVEQTQHKETTLETILRLSANGNLQKGLEFIKEEQLCALKELMQQLNGRKHRQPQLYCVGGAGTGKTYLFQLLASVTRCFQPCLENGERAFAGYSDELYDWIFVNDFHDNIKFQLLSNLCEGTRYKLNSYGCQVEKKKNIPIVFTANEKPFYKNLGVQRQKALHTRMKFLEFQVDHLEEPKEIEIVDLCAVLQSLN